MLTVRPCTNPTTWNDLIRELGGHPLQLWGWGEVKARHRWSAERLVVADGDDVVGAAQILTRKLPVVGDAVRHVPRGPVWKEGFGEAVVGALMAHVKGEGRGIVMQLEPDVETLPLTEKMKPSPSTILLADTLILDTSGTEEDVLAKMHKKTRYYVRKVEKEGQVTFRRALTEADIDTVMSVYHETAARAEFGLHSDDYYGDIHRELGEDSVVIMAEHEGQCVGFLWDVMSNATAFELYGGSTSKGQELFANYGLKLAMIRECQQRGVSRYDLNGLLDGGVASFKRGFWSGHTDKLAGSWDVPLSTLYVPFVQGLPLAKQALRQSAGFRRAALRRLR